MSKKLRVSEKFSMKLIFVFSTTAVVSIRSCFQEVMKTFMKLLILLHYEVFQSISNYEYRTKKKICGRSYNTIFEFFSETVMGNRHKEI